jgi:hypothetical protein
MAAMHWQLRYAVTAPDRDMTTAAFIKKKSAFKGRASSMLQLRHRRRIVTHSCLLRRSWGMICPMLASAGHSDGSI